MKKKIPVFDIKLNKSEKKYALECLKTSQIGQGRFIKKFENKFSKYVNCKYGVTTTSGTTALHLACSTLNLKKNDEVLISSSTNMACAFSVEYCGAIPVPIDIEMNTWQLNVKDLEKKITKKTKAIMPVHLTGRVCEMDKILKISRKYKLSVIEDAAQAIGSKFNGIFAGKFGDFGCFSAHPLKNLNAMGDSGYLITKSKKHANYISDLKNHGMTDRNKIKNFGYVSRMDNLQAAILSYRMKHLNDIIKIRRQNFNIYKKYLNRKIVYFPEEKNKEFNTYHTFVIQVPHRNKLKMYLKKKGVQTAIHYPVPIHLQPAAKRLGYKYGDFPITEKQSKKIITLPINQYLKKKEIIFISNLVNEFYK